MQGCGVLLACALSMALIKGGAAQSLLCDGCDAINGACFFSHPTDCSKYVHCSPNGLGGMSGVVNQCAFATYWNSAALTCVPIEDADCPNDRCEAMWDGYQYEGAGNCRGLYECKDGKSAAKCCEPGYRYEMYEGTLQCVEDATCNDTCFNEVNNETVCDKRAVPGDATMFEQFRIGFGWQPMYCAPGTNFLESFCLCASLDDKNVQGMVCKPEIYLPFDDNTKDMSGNQYHVSNENVGVANGMAIFDGTSRLVIPRFTNLDHSDTVVITAIYTPYGDPSNGKKRALVSNDDCTNEKRSLLIAENATDVVFEVRTNPFKPYEVTVPQGVNPTKQISYVFNNGFLEGSTEQGMESIAVEGTVSRVHCGLHIGHARNYERFVGTIDEMTIYLCKPPTF